MLRRPGEWPVVRLGEGCSSAAFGTLAGEMFAAWFNPADRGSANISPARVPAVP
jgi:hypothetical protein